MMAPPGYPNTVVTPKWTKVSQMISDPGVSFGSVLGVGLIALSITFSS